MNPLPVQLTHAYRQEQRHYERIRDLVQEQASAMGSDPQPGSVLRLSREIEELMAQIAAIEQAIEPAKKCWQESAEKDAPELDAVLAAIEKTIAEIADSQQQVQDALLRYVQKHQQQTDSARASIRTSRARSLYKAG
jgi:hypothetical protein